MTISPSFLKLLREEEENNLPQMKPLFFLYVWLNLTRIAGLCKENLAKHIKKRTIQTGRLFFSSSLINRLYLEKFCMQLTLSFSDTLPLFFAPYRRVCSSK